MRFAYYPKLLRNHSDICELNENNTRGSRKRYFITFIDDYFRFTYVYLLISKDEAS